MIGKLKVNKLFYNMAGMGRNGGGCSMVRLLLNEGRNQLLYSKNGELTAHPLLFK
jgi:hypothetical protein